MNRVNVTTISACGNKKSVFFIAALLLWIIPGTVLAQSMEDFYRKSAKNNQTAMWMLGTWAIGNMTVGGISMRQTDGSAKYFHQMNLMWNTVNLGIATYGLLSKTPEFTPIWEELVSNHRKTENLYLINAGLDLVYMASGAYMIHRSKSSLKKADMLEGYGKSVILQGGFLLAFDTLFWLVQRNLRTTWNGSLAISPTQDYQGIQLTLLF
jgi:hypothetical protein